MHEDLNNYIALNTDRAVMVHCLIDLEDCFMRKYCFATSPPHLVLYAFCTTSVRLISSMDQD